MFRLGVLGGTFNPVHVGHIRLAIEMAEALALERVELIPAARPPHKAGAGMLPFRLRASLLEMAIEGLDVLGVNLMEEERPGPSYTWDTLTELGLRHPQADIHFIMGASDLLNLHLWKNGLELPGLANLAVATRDKLGRMEIEDYLDAHPEMKLAPDGRGGWVSHTGKRIELVDIPRLDISASFIRERFRRGANLRFLVPSNVEKQLNLLRGEVLASWF